MVLYIPSCGTTEYCAGLQYIIATWSQRLHYVIFLRMHGCRVGLGVRGVCIGTWLDGMRRPSKEIVAIFNIRVDYRCIQLKGSTEQRKVSRLWGRSEEQSEIHSALWRMFAFGPGPRELKRWADSHIRVSRWSLRMALIQLFTRLSMAIFYRGWILWIDSWKDFSLERRLIPSNSWQISLQYQSFKNSSLNLHSI